MKKKILGALMPILGVCAFAQTPVDEKFLTSCPFTRGDSITRVKAYYQTEAEPTRMSTALSASPTIYQYHFPDYGVWVFLDASLQVQSLRFEAPFRGSVGGIAVGASADDLRRQKGEPLRTFQGFPDNENIKQRKAKKQQALDALADPAPKDKVRALFDEFARIDSAPLVWGAAWMYGVSNTAGWQRYDVSPTTNKVTIVLAGSCNP
jgi:hypothetical protein